MELSNNEIVGKIHSTESFGTVDGPGIRFVIFMQGCPLKCKYCHNRDTWNIDDAKEIVTVDEMINRIMRYKPYIVASNGGVTVSGGEPLLQLNFVTRLFKELQRLNIHTALDTAGSIPINERIENLLKYTDLVILDIKHIDDEKAKDLTSLSNKNNLDFARYLDKHHIPVWIRQVLIPGYTNDENDLRKLKTFIDTLSNVERTEILPYHKLGEYKWETLGEDYPLKGVEPPSKEEIQKAKEILGI